MKSYQYIKDISQISGLTVIKLSKSITTESLPTLQKEYTDATNGKAVGSILFDLKEVSQTDSSGIAGLLDLLKYMKIHNIKGRIGLINLSDRAQAYLSISKVESFFRIYSSLDEALRDLDS
jgi:anti-anti-sigma factor